jgi:hypothetical protein
MKIALLPNLLLALDPTHNLVAQVSLSDQRVSSTKPNLDVGNLSSLASLTSSAIFVTDRPSLLELSSSWKLFDATFPTPHPVISGLAVFQSKLYILDTGQNRILRLTRGGSSYGQATNWLKDAIDLQAANSIAVDGSVFIGYHDGRIDKFFSGRKSTFPLATIDPPLTNIDQLWTSADSSTLYILDGSQHRIVLFGKQGQLRNQLTTDQWSHASQFAVDEHNKLLYVLAGTSILRSALP